jgi:hypothetical protein
MCITIHHNATFVNINQSVHDASYKSVASGSGAAPASGSESPPARREGLLPRRESLWLGESDKVLRCWGLLGLLSYGLQVTCYVLRVKRTKSGILEYWNTGIIASYMKPEAWDLERITRILKRFG